MRYIRLTCFIIVLLIFFPALSLAESLPLSLALKTAINQNPEISMYKEKWLSFKAKIPKSLSLDDPKVGIERQAIGMKMYTIMQMIPFPGKIISEWKMASHEAKMYNALYIDKTLDITRQVKHNYYDLFFLDRSIETLTEIKNFLFVIKNTSEAKYITGSVIQADVLQANMEYLLMNNDLINTGQERKIKEEKMKTLLNINNKNSLTVTNNLNLIPTINACIKYEKIASENNSQIIAMKEDVYIKKYFKLKAVMDFFPDTSIELKKRAGDGIDTMLSFSVPLYPWKQSYGISSAKHDLSSSSYSLTNMINMTIWEVRESWTMADSFKRTELLYKQKIIPQSYQALKNAMSAYTVGKIDFQSLLQLLRLYKEAKLKFYENQVNYGKSLANLEKIIGKELKQSYAK